MTDKKTEALKLAQEAIDDRASLTRWKKARDAIREALAEQPAQQQEPVACVHIKDGCLVGSHRDGSKLFPDGQYGLWPIDNPPASKPLTDEEIEALLPEPDGTAEVDSVRVLVAPGLYGTEYTEADAWTKESIIQVARAIEAAHGIKGDA